MSETGFRIERLTPAPVLELPPDHALAGAAYRFPSEGVVPAGFLRITLPHEQPGRVVAPYTVVEDCQVLLLEPCRVTEAWVVFYGRALDTFVPLHETVDYPASVVGLGSGHVTATFLGETIEFDLDDAPSYAAHVAQDAGAVPEVSGMRAALPVRMLHLAILWNPSGSGATLVDASLAVFDGDELTLWRAVPDT